MQNELETKCKILKNKEGGIPFHIQPATFFISAFLIFGFVAVTIPFSAKFKDLFSTLLNMVNSNFGWFLVFTINILLFYCIYLALSKYSSIKIGGQDAEPEFTTIAWLAMLFSAGLGIGLLFYGVAEPIYHFGAPPIDSIAPKTREAAVMGLNMTFLHWGFHPWASYSVVGLALAFATFNRGLPLSIRTAFYELIGDRIYGPIGNAVDISATVATLFGVATSLGIGAQQVNAGLNYLFGVPVGPLSQIIIISVITMFATISVVAGLDAGIKRASFINIIVTGTLGAFIFVVGPTIFVADLCVQSAGYYLQNLLYTGTWLESWNATNWQNFWTLFYWCWWIGWAPFVGMFIGRISYGRTVREYLVGTIVVPVALSIIWFTLLGGSALHIEMFGAGGIAEAVQESLSVSIFKFLENFALPKFSSALAVVAVTIFFVTSSDSGSMVIDMITAGGHTDPPKPQRVFWAVTEGVVGAALLAGGGLVALQTAAVVSGLPFAVVVLLMCWSLQKGLKSYYEEFCILPMRPIPTQQAVETK